MTSSLPTAPADPGPPAWLAVGFPLVGAIALLTVVFTAVAALAGPARPAPHSPAADPVNYVGSKRCKMCHSATHTGDAYGAWTKEKHAGAWRVLDSDAAKALAKKAGVAGSPQAAAACLRCHVTAYGVAPERLEKSFDPKEGVSCESCHGPGEAHARARLKYAMTHRGADPKQRVELPAGEVVARPEPATCLACHNAESPSFQPFCFRERVAQIQHFDPRKPRDPAEAEALKCACEKPCACKKGDCGGWPTETELAAARAKLAAAKDK